MKIDAAKEAMQVTKDMSDTDAIADKVIEKLAKALDNLSLLDDDGLRSIATSAEVSPTPEQRLKSAIARLLIRR
jgi:hypothetical protein